MKSDAMQEIEKQLPALSAEENLLLIEELVHRLRERESKQRQREALAEMARDPEIQREVRAIAEEFASTEEDGLGGM